MTLTPRRVPAWPRSALLLRAQVKPRTESGRDAMLRAGVRAALASAQEGSLSLLGGDQPNKWVAPGAVARGWPQRQNPNCMRAEPSGQPHRWRRLLGPAA